MDADTVTRRITRSAVMSRKGMGEATPGYDSTAGQLYVAVVIDDDDVVTRPSLPAMLDRCEIFVDGNHGEQDTRVSEFESSTC